MMILNFYGPGTYTLPPIQMPRFLLPTFPRDAQFEYWQNWMNEKIKEAKIKELEMAAGKPIPSHDDVEQPSNIPIGEASVPSHYNPRLSEITDGLYRRLHDFISGYGQDKAKYAINDYLAYTDKRFVELRQRAEKAESVLKEVNQAFTDFRVMYADEQAKKAEPLKELYALVKEGFVTCTKDHLGVDSIAGRCLVKIVYNDLEKAQRLHRILLGVDSLRSEPEQAADTKADPDATDGPDIAQGFENIRQELVRLVDLALETKPNPDTKTISDAQILRSNVANDLNETRKTIVQQYRRLYKHADIPKEPERAKADEEAAKKLPILFRIGNDLSGWLLTEEGRKEIERVIELAGNWPNSWIPPSHWAAAIKKQEIEDQKILDQFRYGPKGVAYASPLNKDFPLKEVPSGYQDVTRDIDTLQARVQELTKSVSDWSTLARELAEKVK